MAASTTSASEELEEEEYQEEQEEKKPANSSKRSPEPIPDYRFASLSEGPLVHGGEFGWFSDFGSTTCTMLESPVLIEDRSVTTDNEMAMTFTMREEDELLFADLGELPECSTVFRRGMAQREADQRPPSLATTT
jgi:hypothetical protein